MIKTKTSNPLVSIIISSYNHEKYVRRMIESVLGQTYTNLEVLAVDDCSSDNTYSILEEYVSDKRIKLSKNSINMQVVYNINECIKNSKGEYISFIGSDDAWKKDKIEKQVKYLEENPKFAGCFTKCKLIDEYDNYWEDKFAELPAFKFDLSSQASAIRFAFDEGNPFMHPSAMIRKSVIDEIGLFNPLLRQTHDYEYWCRILLKYPLATIKEPLLIYRLEKDEKTSMSSTNIPGLTRTVNECTSLIYKLIVDVSDDLFIEAFGDRFDNQGISTVDILCKKYLLLRDWGFLVESNFGLAQRFLFDYCNNPEVIKVMQEKYCISLNEIYEDTGKVVQYYPDNFYSFYNDVNDEKDKWHSIADERLEFINNMQNSRSWKLTRPIRALGKLKNK